MKSGITLCDITKAFNEIEVLHPISMNFDYGKVHALVGENGAGKSTMMKVIAGIQPPSSGEVYKDGKKLVSYTPKEAKENKISFIHQELSYISELTVAENIFLGREPRKNTFIDYHTMHKCSQELISSLGLSINSKEKIGNLKQAAKQLVEIVKAVSLEADIIIMDEPTSSLSYHETEKLFQLIKTLVYQDKCVIFISHKLDEVFQIADTISVLRDGSLVGTWPVNKLNMDELIFHMVGRPIENIFPKREIMYGNNVLEVQNLSKSGEFNDVSFELKRGEILGIAGLVGAGRTETMQAIFGLKSHDTGEVLFYGEKINIKKPSDAVRLGISYIPEDRKEMGLVLMMSVGKNISLSSLQSFTSKIGIIQEKKEQGLIEKQAKSMSIRVNNYRESVSKLSGGNQQKVVLAKWLAISPKVLILDEPTKGVDVGAKQEIYTVMSEYVSNGNSIIMVSSDMIELIGMSDRIVVFNNGSVSGLLEKNDFSQEKILHLGISGFGGEF